MSCARSLHFAVLAAALSAVPTSVANQQRPLDPLGNAQLEQSNTVTAPQQLRRIEPPSPLAPAAELERQADSLRAQKLFADSIDYYAAALKKAGPASQLHNKI